MKQTTAQRLRQQLAEMSSDYTWVRTALAAANDVNPAMDLVVAARVATIVENLDRIADTNEAAYRDSLTQLRKGKIPAGIDAGTISGLSGRALRSYLVKHFIVCGQDAVDAVFFAVD